jgi:hypothetical protein
MGIGPICLFPSKMIYFAGASSSSSSTNSYSVSDSCNTSSSFG